MSARSGDLLSFDGGGGGSVSSVVDVGDTGTSSGLDTESRRACISEVAFESILLRGIRSIHSFYCGFADEPDAVGCIVGAGKLDLDAAGGRFTIDCDPPLTV